MSARKPYSGVRALVFGIDVGTTFSGISYSILEPGQVPVIKSITRFPGQQEVGGDSKVPTSIYYDREGIVRAEGADTTLAASVEKAEDEGWEHAQWFKLHLRPDLNNPDIPPLPHRKTATSVLADFLRYLFECAKIYIEETHPSGHALWLSLQHNIHFVWAHPNGWEGKQQNQMRDAAVVAGLIPNSDAGHERLRFVTEGEASLHFCVENGLATETIDRGHGVVIVDAGGGTIDLSTYCMVKKSNGYKEYEEIAPPQCLFQGSIYVTQRARDYVQAHLANSRYDGDVDSIAREFDASAKTTFRGEEFSYIKFGSRNDNNPGLNIRNGQLKIPGHAVKRFFEPSISATVSAVREQCISALSITVSTVLLVGGFAANDYVFSELKSRLEPLRLDLARPDTHVNKAVADGAVSFYIDHHVSVRVARFTYGLTCSEPYNRMNMEHFTRAAKRYKGVSGEWLVPGRFSTILNKGVQVCETTEFRESYHRRTSDRAVLDYFSIELLTYRGRGDPQWVDVDPELYKAVCKVEADTSHLIKVSTRRRGVPNSDFYELRFDVILSFGLTELKAQIAWQENGVEKRGPAQILY
ncbi:hypothetical protein DFH07DRAFT_844923 [Mycena maculata]|uniref:Actin-like ATPase domain-containing protein n=1 Tax=Mycena maculata TaxID=230809 RepID=A0AAD7MVE2_9AGAR|nr:hypothetical protein DFH07DRAFT_844923 [Mycena maculata]